MTYMHRDLDEDFAINLHKNYLHWWNEPRSIEKLLLLATSELCEAMEGIRKDLMDDHLPHRTMEEVEIADFLHRVLDTFGHFGWTIDNKKLYEAVEHHMKYMPDSKPDALWCGITSMGLGYADHYDLRISKPGLPEGSEFVMRTLQAAITFAIQYAKKFDLDLWGAFDEKLEYNLKRQDHKDEVRAAAGGKKW